MSRSALKRWIFAALLLALIAGTILGHAHAAPLLSFGAGQSHAVSWDDSPIALQQKLGEISKRTQTKGAGVSAEDGALWCSPQYGLLPIDILFWTRV